MVIIQSSFYSDLSTKVIVGMNCRRTKDIADCDMDWISKSDKSLGNDSWNVSMRFNMTYSDKFIYLVY